MAGITKIKAKGIIDKLDKVLEKYYATFNRNYKNSDGIGKFREFADENSFDDEDVLDELKVEKAEECTLCDFDVNENDENMFPLSTDVNDINHKIEEIFKILKVIAINGSYTAEHVAFDYDLLSVCDNITQQDIDNAVSKYKTQMECFGDAFHKDRDLQWFLAVNDKCKFPFITYMVDIYTRDKARKYGYSLKKKPKPKSQNLIFEWAKDNPFMKALKHKYPQKRIEEKLRNAMVNYGNRIMTRLKFTPTIKIKDNLKEICEYVASIPAFIKKLMEQFLATPPFQIDLLIAVKGVRTEVGNGDDDDYDEEDGSDEKALDPNKDHIGDVKKNLRNYPLAHFYRNDEDIEESEQLRNTITRILGQRWNDFRTELSEFNERHARDDEKSWSPRIKYNAKTYPQNRRFSIFVDRRVSEDDNESKENKDQIMFFQPPSYSDTINNDHVPEIGFDLIRKCLIPKKGVDKNKDDNITALHPICGQLMTFMFNVEQKDEIRCYIVWNGQTMRFEGEHVMEVLPYLFEDNDENVEFIKERKQLEQIKQLFTDEMKDEKFNQFCKKVNAFK